MLILFLKRSILNHCREASYMKPAFFPLSCVLSSFGFCLVSFVFFFWAMLISFVSDPVCLWLFITVGRWSVLFHILYTCGCSSRSVAPLICPSEMAECYRFLTYLVITCLSACPFACLLLYSHIHSFNYLPVHLHTSLPAYLPTYLLNYLRN